MSEPDLSTFTRLERSLVALDLKSTLAITAELNQAEVSPIEIMTSCEKALVEIGEMYASGEYYISGLIMAGEIMNRLIALLTPRMTPAEASSLSADIVIGTVKGDIHSLGKNIAGTLLSAYGFTVTDLGEDVPVLDFIETCRNLKPDIVGISSLLTSCYPQMKDTVTAIRSERGDANLPIIIISGAQITKEHQKLFGADYQVDTAFNTVRLCQQIIQKRTR